MCIKNIILATSLIFPLSLSAGEYDAKVKDIIDSKLRAEISTPDVINAIKTQNAKNSNLTQDEINNLDEKWKADDQALISSVLGNDLSKNLKNLVNNSNGLYTEIFVMDNKGLNVGQSAKTSDYWQGDEAKWQQTFKVGPDAINLSDVEFDESSQSYQLQASFTINDNNVPVGSVTVGINADKLK